jgi:hypothetical protein
MRHSKLVLAVFTLMFLFSGVLSAGIVWRPAERDGFLTDIRIGAYFNNYLYKYNNGDLRATDNTSIQTVEITDDNIFIGYLELGAKLEADLLNGIQFFLDVYRVGYWGNDSPEYVTPSPIYFRELYFTAPVFDFLTASVGRFRYAMYSEDRLHNNYVLTDLIDAVLLQADMGMFGVDFIVDLFSMNSPIDSVYELRAPRHRNTTRYFDGDVNIIRFSLIPNITPIEDENMRINVKPYAMFSRIGAVGKADGTMGGHEQTIAGSTGNHADNDWLFMTGLTTYAQIEDFSAYLEFGYAMGKDRKGPGIPDVDFSGIMIHGSLAYNIKDLFSVTLAGLYTSGAKTDADGNYTNYGYVSFKADKIGGFLFRDYYGMYPYSILDSRGISVEPTDAARRSPMAGVMLRGGFHGAKPLDINFEFWTYFDTSTSGADFNSHTLAADKFDQRRFGEFMGWELNLKFAWTVNNDMLKIGVDTGVFVPGKFYSFPVASIMAPFGNDTFYGISVFSSLRF